MNRKSVEFTGLLETSANSGYENDMGKLKDWDEFEFSVFSD